MLKAVHHCHSQGIAHRDLKLENFMIDGNDNIHLISFDHATICYGKPIRNKAGSIYFRAPEVWNENYGLKCDMWSLGCLLYTMLSGKLAFNGESDAEIQYKVKEGEINFNIAFDTVSDECKDLIKNLLKVEPDYRFDAGQALKHEWFKKEENLAS